MSTPSPTPAQPDSDPGRGARRLRSAGPDPADAQARVEPGPAEPAPVGHSLASVVAPEVDQMLDAMVELAPPLPVEVRMRLAYLLGRHRPAPTQTHNGGGSYAAGSHDP